MSLLHAEDPYPEYGIIYCGPGTTWNEFSKVCIPFNEPTTADRPACPNAYERDEHGNCLQKMRPEKNCGQFRVGVDIEGDVVGEVKQALSSEECALRCLRDYDSEFFTYSDAGNLRSCICRNNGHHIEDKKHPHCKLDPDGDKRGVNVYCGTTMIKQRLHQLSHGKDSKQNNDRNMKECQRKAEKGDFGVCPTHVSGETCSVNIVKYCDATTKLSNDKCVAKPPDMSKACDAATTVFNGHKCVRKEFDRSAVCDKASTEFKHGKCRGKAPPHTEACPVPPPVPSETFKVKREPRYIDLDNAACVHQTSEMSLKVFPVDGAKSCAKHCLAHGRECVASTYDDSHGHCQLFKSCAAVESRKLSTTSVMLEPLDGEKMEAQFCGEGTHHDAKSNKCMASTPASLSPTSHKLAHLEPHQLGAGTVWDKEKQQCSVDMTEKGIGNLFCRKDTKYDIAKKHCVSKTTDVYEKKIQDLTQSLSKSHTDQLESQKTIQKMTTENSEMSTKMAQNTAFMNAQTKNLTQLMTTMANNKKSSDSATGAPNAQSSPVQDAATLKILQKVLGGAK